MVAQDRGREFSRIDAQTTPLRPRLFADIVSSIRRDYDSIRVGEDLLLPEQLHKIIEMTFRWNCLSKGRHIDQLYRPFSPPIGTPFNNRTSKLYYAYAEEENQLQVAAVVTMGLQVSDLIAQVGSVAYVVVMKVRAQVIVAGVCDGPIF